MTGHNTSYTRGRGCFPLCEKCWRDLKTPAARMPYYRQLWSEWLQQTYEPPWVWCAIESAVLEGK